VVAAVSAFVGSPFFDSSTSASDSAWLTFSVVMSEIAAALSSFSSSSFPVVASSPSSTNFTVAAVSASVGSLSAVPSDSTWLTFSVAVLSKIAAALSPPSSASFPFFASSPSSTTS